MNGKKAKALRSLAGHLPGSHTQYEAVSHTRKQHKIYGNAIDLQGNPIPIGQYDTITFRMKSGSRLLYKNLKRLYKQKQQLGLAL